MEYIMIIAFGLNALGWAIRGYPTASALATIAMSISALAYVVKKKDLSDINKHRMW